MPPRVSDASASSFAPEQSISDESLTFGVELEFVYAFHESLLTLDSADRIQKHIPYNRREVPPFTVINTRDLPNHAYNSWGILKNGKPPAQPYEQEAVNTLSESLQSLQPAIKFQYFGTMLMTDKTSDKYTDWLLCKDHTVCGVGSRNIFPGRLQTRIEAERPEEWDSIGVEAVSKVYHSGSAHGERVIGLVVDAVKGNDEDFFGSFITNRKPNFLLLLKLFEAYQTVECALHVHVQAPEDLDVLKELALILLVYEEEICRLHPPCRRPHHRKGFDGPRGSLDSNRLSWVKDGGPMPDRHSRQFQELDRTVTGLKGQWPSINELRTDLRTYIDTNDDLALYMNAPPGATPHNFGNRNRLVNFTTAAARGDQYPKTIEFRQARGSLCAQEIMHWVKFCVGIVKLATLYKENSDKFPIKNWPDSTPGPNGIIEHDRIDVFDLIRDMKLPQEEVEYWRRTMALYQLGQPGDENDRTDNELPPSESVSDSQESGDSHGGAGVVASGGGDEDRDHRPEDQLGGEGQVDPDAGYRRGSGGPPPTFTQESVSPPDVSNNGSKMPTKESKSDLL
ncbi:hypothetical protein D0Z07_5622 [Hyphodiscus hymeniophilus]|uniref:Uncharacterized protein n=1 Tax=Hyphodiscus hymeniophilus TaxID=353542 RepID=A0A9P7AW67_9HELO|nr:hypothetical protein D0Z07_5622 [Hyphodiscus hymeniophilus]